MSEVNRAVTGHRRFALRDVTLDGVPVGGATVDSWREGEDARWWSARLLLPLNDAVRDGLLSGTGVDGRRVSGLVRSGGATAGLRMGRTLLVELHGDGPLEVELVPVV